MTVALLQQRTPKFGGACDVTILFGTKWRKIVNKTAVGILYGFSWLVLIFPTWSAIFAVAIATVKLSERLPSSLVPRQTLDWTLKWHIRETSPVQPSVFNSSEVTSCGTYHECECALSLRSQERLNHCMIIHVHTEITNKLNTADIGNQFVSAWNDRQKSLWKIRCQ